MNTKAVIKFILVLILFFGTSCVKDELELDKMELDGTLSEEIEINHIEDLDIPDNFDFSTQKEVEVSISDSQVTTAYAIIVGDATVFNGFITDQGIKTLIKIPPHITEISLLRKTQFGEEDFIVSIVGTKVSFNFDGQ